MTGRLICIVGPSGVGKDSVMEALAATSSDFLLARRVITRPSAAGGEDFEGVTCEEFAARVAGDEFLFHWCAHGLRYGVPSLIQLDLKAGRHVIVNLSRGILSEVTLRFPDALIIALSAPAEVLAARLAGRGRESASEIAKRLERAEFAIPQGVTFTEVDNSGPIAQTVRSILALLPSKEESSYGT